MCASSRDILNLTLAAAVAILTFLFAWLLIYVIRTVKTVVDFFDRLRALVNEIEATLNSMKDKIKEAGIILPVLMKAAEKLVAYVGERRRVQKSKSKNQNDGISSRNGEAP